MIPQEIIRKKRDKKVLSKEEISLFVKGLTDGSFSDSQVAAMSMAIFLNGMIPEETVNLNVKNKAKQNEDGANMIISQLLECEFK